MHKTINLFGIKIKFGDKYNLLKHTFILKLFDLIIPKTSKNIVFLCDCYDNGLELYNYIKKNSNSYNLILLYHKTKPFYDIENLYNINSLKGIWYLLRSKYLIKNFFLVEKFTRSPYRCNIQLWHGMPLKTIGLMEKNIPDKYKKLYILDKNSKFFVSSDIFKVLMSATFNADPNNVYITGQPRNDIILKEDNNAYNIYDKMLSISKYKKILLYTPTYKELERGKGKPKDIEKQFNNIFYMDDYDEKNLISFLEQNNYLLVVKPHPAEEYFYKDLLKNGVLKSDNIKFIYNENLNNNKIFLYSFFKYTDLMITDFSSIAIDYFLSNKPIVFLDTLSKEYNNNRGFTLEDNYEILMPGAKVRNFNELLNQITDALTVDSWKEKRSKNISLLHKYTDTKACERIFNIIKNL